MFLNEYNEDMELVEFRVLHVLDHFPSSYQNTIGWVTYKERGCV